MAQQNLGLTVFISTCCGLIGGFFGGLLAPLVAAGFVFGAAAAVTESVQEDTDKKGRTAADMQIIGTASESYAIDNRRYADADSIVALAVRLEPTYVSKVPYEDGWGNRFLVKSGGREYEIRSQGPDGIANNFDDIVYSNGEFTQYP